MESLLTTDLLKIIVSFIIQFVVGMSFPFKLWSSTPNDSLPSYFIQRCYFLALVCVISRHAATSFYIVNKKNRFSEFFVLYKLFTKLYLDFVKLHSGVNQTQSSLYIHGQKTSILILRAPSTNQSSFTKICINV